MAYCILNIALDTPLTSSFDYRWPCEPGAEPLPWGSWRWSISATAR
jgi:hypothetical protein